MNFNDECAICKKVLTHDETALTRKFISRDAKEFLCYDCLGKRFKMSREELLGWVEKFKKDGCTLFI